MGLSCIHHQLVSQGLLSSMTPHVVCLMYVVTRSSPKQPTFMAEMTWIWYVLSSVYLRRMFSYPTLVATVRLGLFKKFLEASSSFNKRGNGGLTYEESKSHFTAWALMKSPLLVCYLSCHYPTDPYPSFRLERM